MPRPPRHPADDLLATDHGLDALFLAAIDRGVSTADWPRGVGGEALASHLLARAGEPDIASVLARARLHVRYRGPVPASVELVASRAVTTPLRDLAALAEALRAALSTQLTQRGLPDAATVRASRRGAAASFAITVPSRWTDVTTEGGARALAYRAIAASIDLEGKRARVTTAHDAHVGLLSAALGLACAGDARLFRPAPLIALSRLQRGPRSLRVPKELRGILARIRLIECEIDTGHTATLALAGRDCMKDMTKLGLHIEGGALLSAVLRFDYGDGSLPTDVTLHPPNEIVCSDVSREELIRRCLAKMRVLTRAAPQRDLWSSEPWEDTDAGARASYQGAFDALTEEGVLVRSNARAVAHPDAPEAGRRLIAFPIAAEPGAWYGVAHGSRFAPRTLGESDLVTWKLSLLALGRRIAKALGAAGEVALLERRGVIDLGILTMGPTYVRLFLILRAPTDPVALAARLRLRASPGHAIVIVPPGRTTKTGLPEVPLARVEGPYDSIATGAARTLGFEDAIDPRLQAPPTARVVVHRASRRVWLDGVLIRGLREQVYRLVEILADAHGKTRFMKDVAIELSGGKDLDAARRAKYLLLEAITASFAEEGRPVPADVESLVEKVRRGEVRMGLPVFLL